MYNEVTLTVCVILFISNLRILPTLQYIVLTYVNRIQLYMKDWMIDSYTRRVHCNTWNSLPLQVYVHYAQLCVTCLKSSMKTGNTPTTKPAPPFRIEIRSQRRQQNLLKGYCKMEGKKSSQSIPKLTVQITEYQDKQHNSIYNNDWFPNMCPDK